MKCPHCGKESADERFFRKCFDLIEQHFPYITATTNLAPIHLWANAGYDYDLHVKPAVDAAKRSGKTVGLSYITAIIESSAKRTVAPLKERDLRTDGEKEAARARSVAFKVRRAKMSLPTDEIWLQQYEARHGEVRV